ncbi:ThiF family adenylyltransferase [Botrimarina sp.]|uniref:ThiF family adenylyltransferase n=1 Tax=Botrimarina sp. TaxID=2795802 RepID=UPI0032EE0C5E
MPDRYAKQTRFAPLGEQGQRRLGEASVLLCGCGALGSVIAQTLVRAGVGRLTLVDRDFLELSNLQRQVLFNEADVAQRLPKAVAAAAHLRAANSEVEVEPVVADVTAANLAGLAAGHTLLMDGADNFETRLLVNDYAVREGVPWVYGGVIGAEGRVMPVLPGESACLACLVPEPPAPGDTPTCDSAGVLGPAVGVVASLQAIEAMKLIAGAADAVAHGLTVVDLWAGQWRRLAVQRDPQCRACGRRRFDWLEGRRGSQAVVLCGRESVQLSPPRGAPPVDLEAMRARLAPLGEVAGNDYLLRLRYEGHDITLFEDGRAIISGVDDEAAARSVWARCLGG